MPGSLCIVSHILEVVPGSPIPVVVVVVGFFAIQCGFSSSQSQQVFLWIPTGPTFMLCLSIVCDVPCLRSASWDLVFANSSGAEHKDVREQTQPSAFRATLRFSKEHLPL